MRELPVALMLAFGLPALADEPPSKRGLGFFGFGAPPTDQISGDLSRRRNPGGINRLGRIGLGRNLPRRPAAKGGAGLLCHRERPTHRAPRPGPVEKARVCYPVQPLPSPTPSKPIVAAPARRLRLLRPRPWPHRSMPPPPPRRSAVRGSDSANATRPPSRPIPFSRPARGRTAPGSHPRSPPNRHPPPNRSRNRSLCPRLRPSLEARGEDRTLSGRGSDPVG